MAVAVIGGGISGISAALDLARSGFKVYLIEKNHELGGKVSELAECKIGLSPWIVEVENHPNIELLLSSEVEGLSGSAGDFRLNVSGRAIKVASIIVAPGYDVFENISKSYAIDHPDVLTALDFERLLRGTTRTGKLIRPSNGKPVKKIGFIQCVGSRCTENELCSTVCCAYTAKEAKIIKQRFPEVAVYIFYIDLRVFGKDVKVVEEIANKYDVNYLKSRVPEIIPEGESLIVKFENFEKGTIQRVDLDMVVLAIGLQPSKSLPKLAEITGVKTDSFGYIETSFTNPLETNVPGIFVCGTANAPMNVEESIAQGSAAALRASLLSERAERVKDKRERIEAKGEPRIGIFICGCEGVIGNSLDISAIAERVKNLPDVVFVTSKLDTCEDANNAIERGILDQKLNRVVFAGCTPRGHEAALRSVCAKAGLDPYQLEIANIREHCAWVHEKEAATEVAGELITMAVEHVRHLEDSPIELYPVIPKALVIGGGVSGMHAALDIANAGYEVYLVEKGSELGGFLNEISECPTGDNAADILNRLAKKLEGHERVSVYLNTEVEAFWGRPGAFTARIGGGEVSEEIEVGAVILATGGEEFKPAGYFGYGTDKKVMIQREFEQLLKDRVDASTIVMLQDMLPDAGVYSKYSSTEVVTNALRAKKLSPKSNIFVLYQDIKTYGKWELYYKEAREQGVVFLRYDKERPPELEEGVISVHDAILNDEILIKPDLVVLSTPMLPAEGNKKLSELFNIPLDDRGFFLGTRERPKMNLTPVDTPNKGVFICGSAIYPAMMDECLVQAGAAASRTCCILSNEYMAVEPLAARVDETLCRGCDICEQICEYGAITLNESNGVLVAKVNEALCKGCGACAVACPVRAITCRYFTLKQIASMIDVIA